MTVCHDAGRPERYREIGSCTFKRPRSWRSKIQAAVNCLPREAILNLVWTVFAAPPSSNNFDLSVCPKVLAAEMTPHTITAPSATREECTWNAIGRLSSLSICVANGASCGNQEFTSNPLSGLLIGEWFPDLR